MKFSRQIAIVVAALVVAVPGLLGSRDQAATAASQDAAASPAASGSQIPVAFPKGKKLVLKDGSFQLAREYSVEGDRVRYWSVERSQWEEIPASMIDWDATHKFETEQASRDAELKAKIHASNMARLTKDIDVDRSLEIKPGLFLPDDVGLYALDRDKQIRPMKQDEAVVKTSTGREVEKILSGIPLIPGKASMQIAGEHAPIRLATDDPEFYMRPADRREPRFQLVRLQIKGGRRLIDTISIRFTGEEKHNTDNIEIQTWTPATGVFRYTVDHRLEPGEYAFVELTADGINGYVWDFAIEPQGNKTR